MSLQDFLFNGNPPPSVTTYGTATNNLPQWYQDYLQGIAASGNAIAAQPYQPYVDASGSPIPRIADFTQDQQGAMQMVRDNVGNYQPAVNTSINNLSQINPFMGINAGQPYLSQAAGMDALGAASPFLGAAAQSSAGQVGQYMSPYLDQVMDRAGALGARNLNERLLPAVQDTFTRAGQMGSARQTEATGRALRDVNESVIAQQGQLANQGYMQAMQAAQGDLGRFGQIGQTVGQLGLGMQGNMANIGQVSGQLTNTGAANAITAGSELAKSGQIGQAMDIKDAAALQEVGGQQQQLDQRNLSLAFDDFQTQTQYPQTQLSFLSNLLRGYQMPTSSTTMQQRPYGDPTPPGLATLASGIGGIASLFGRKRGGRITHGALSKAHRSGEKKIERAVNKKAPLRGALAMVD
jgi:hypothetical protein